MPGSLSLARRAAALAVLAALLAFAAGCGIQFTTTLPAVEDEADGPGREVFFCFWNLENYFDDKLGENLPKADQGYDEWFAKDAPARKQKIENLCKVLLEMNDGKGPDILGFCEAESERSVELLKAALNKKLKDEKLHYKHIEFHEPKGLGRHINAGVLTRLPVVAAKTEVLGKRQRILRCSVKENGHELVIVASHWTSRLSDKVGDEQEGRGRFNYADNIHEDFEKAWKANNHVDYLVCGDFNDEPSDKSVTDHLHALGDVTKVKGAKDPVLLDLLAKFEDGSHATHVYSRKPYVFDHIVVSPGMLDKKGWSCDPATTAIQTKVMGQPVRGKDFVQPRRFGDEDDETPLGSRGYSDHFPVTVKLKVRTDK